MWSIQDLALDRQRVEFSRAPDESSQLRHGRSGQRCDQPDEALFACARTIASGRDDFAVGVRVIAADNMSCVLACGTKYPEVVFAIDLEFVCSDRDISRC